MEIQTSIEIVLQAKHFNWSVKVQPETGEQGGLTVSESAKSYLAARFQAGEACRKLAEAALNLKWEGGILNYRVDQKTNGLRDLKAVQAAV